MEGEGAPPPPPMMMPDEEPKKKPTTPKKPAVPAILTKEKIIALSEKEKNASDELFLEVLRDISQESYTGEFKKYLAFLWKTLYEKVRKDDVFKKREEFDTIFVKKIKKSKKREQ